MKGRNYVPSSRREPHLPWREGNYSHDNSLAVEGATTQRPRKASKAKVKPRQIMYNWKTSVPKEWYNLKAPETFVHVKDAGSSASTLEFLKSTEKYIHKICHPNFKKDSSARMPKIIVGRSKQPTPIKLLADPAESHDLPEPHKSPQPRHLKVVSSVSVPHISQRFCKTELSPRQKPVLVESCRVVDLSPKLVDNEVYKAKHYVMPRALSSVRKSRLLPKTAGKNRTIDDFMNRFDKAQQPMANPPRNRTGVDGWKLQRVKKSLSKRHLKGVSNSQKSMTVSRDPEVREEGTEVYLEYLMHKRRGVDERASQVLK
jgi:hypothetical protein